MAKHLAQLVVLDLADVGGPGAERGERRHGVGAGAPRHLDRRAHALVERDHPRLVDQGHGAFGEIQAIQRAVLGLGDDVDDGVAKTEDVVRGGRRCIHRQNSTAGRGQARQSSGIGAGRELPFGRRTPGSTITSFTRHSRFSYPVGSMINALLRGFRQLADPAIRRLLLRCVLLTLATLIALIGGVAALLFGLDLTGLTWLDPILATAGSALVLVLAWLLFPIVVALILGLFAEDVIRVVERRHYPDLPAAPGMSLAAQTYAGARFVLVALLLNLLALPLYLVPGRQPARSTWGSMAICSAASTSSWWRDSGCGCARSRSCAGSGAAGCGSPASRSPRC